MSKPKPVNTEPEQYSVNGMETREEVRVTPIAPGNQLGKWVFAVREEGKLVLKKHIGGEKCRANHTIPEAVCHVVACALRQEGYEIVAPTDEYRWVPTESSSYGSSQSGVKVPVSEDGSPLWDAMSDYGEKRVRKALSDD